MVYEANFGSLETPEEPVAIPPEAPFRVAILADLSGRANRGELLRRTELAAQKPLKADATNLEKLLDRAGARLLIPVGGGEHYATLTFAELDDFYPERFLREVELLDDLRDIRSKLDRGSGFDALVSKMQDWAVEGHQPLRPPGTLSRATAIPVTPSLFDLPAYQSQPTVDESQPMLTGDGLIARAVGPYVPRDEEPTEEQAMAAIDKALHDVLREILHHPDYQALESTWRGLDWFMRRLAKGSKVEFVLFDITAEEFAIDLADGDNLNESAIYELLVKKTAHAPDGLPWAMIVGLYQFDATGPHADLLGRMGKIASLLQAPFLSAMQPGVLNEGWELGPEEASAWKQLREQVEAGWVGLATPGFLMRLPVGQSSRPLEEYEPFEEFSPDLGSRSCLWGNPALAVAATLGLNYIQYGWKFKPGVKADLGSMPLYSYRNEDDEQVGVSVERKFTGATATQLVKLGWMPIMGSRTMDVIEVAKVVSLALEPKDLLGRWEPPEGGMPIASAAGNLAKSPFKMSSGGESSSSSGGGDDDASAKMPDEDIDDGLAALMSQAGSSGGGDDDDFGSSSDDDDSSTSTDDEFNFSDDSSSSDDEPALDLGDDDSSSSTDDDTSFDLGDDDSSSTTEDDTSFDLGDDDSSTTTEEEVSFDLGDDDTSSSTGDDDLSMDLGDDDSSSKTDEEMNLADTALDDLDINLGDDEPTASDDEASSETTTDDDLSHGDDDLSLGDDDLSLGDDDSSLTSDDDELSSSDDSDLSSSDDEAKSDDGPALPDEDIDDGLAALLAQNSSSKPAGDDDDDFSFDSDSDSSSDSDLDTDSDLNLDSDSDLSSDADSDLDLDSDSDLSSDSDTSLDEFNLGDDTSDASASTDDEALASFDDDTSLDLGDDDAASETTTDEDLTTFSDDSTSDPSDDDAGPTSAADDDDFGGSDTSDDEAQPAMSETDTEVDPEVAELLAAVESGNYAPFQNGSEMHLAFPDYIKPISEDEPAGVSLSFAMREKFEELRKEINPDAYAPDDPRRPTEPKFADWPGIESLCKELLIEKSKDLQIAARLIEALTKIYGFGGMRDGLHLSRLLCVLCWDRLHPEIEDPDEDREVRAGPFNWLDDPIKSARFPTSVMMIPILFHDGKGYSYMDWKASQDGKSSITPEMIEKAMLHTSREQVQLIYDDTTACLQETTLLTQALEKKMGSDAPALSMLRPAINDVRKLLDQILQKKGPAPQTAAEMQAAAENGDGGGGGVMVAGGGMMQMASRGVTRDDLYRQLSQMADMLAQMEPHSPVPYLIQKAVHFGSLPFPQLMRELVRDLTVLAEMNRELGIKEENAEPTVEETQY